MWKAILALALIAAALLGGLLVLRSSSKLGMPSEEVLGRAKKRARDLSADEQKGGDDADR
jgi:hypothetical protein